MQKKKSTIKEDFIQFYNSITQSLWSEPYNRKYTKKPGCLPLGQIQRLGRQILEALLFLRDRGISTHGHLHSGNVIIQNGVARYGLFISGVYFILLLYSEFSFVYKKKK